MDYEIVKSGDVDERLKELVTSDERRQILGRVLKDHVGSKNTNDGNNTSFDVLDYYLNRLGGRSGAACYAQAPGLMSTHKQDMRYLKSKLEMQTLAKCELKRWISICLDAWALGKPRQSVNEIVKDGLIIDLFDPYWSIDRVYMALSNYRFSREAIHLVRAVIDLVDAGIPFWNAFVFAHGNIHASVGHTWLDFCAVDGYGAGRDKRSNIWMARLLSDLARNKRKPFRPHAYTYLRDKGSFSWTTASHIKTSDKLVAKTSLDHLSDVAIAATSAPDFKTARDIMNKGEAPPQIVEKVAEPKLRSPCGVINSRGYPCKNMTIDGARCRYHRIDDEFFV